MNARSVRLTRTLPRGRREADGLLGTLHESALQRASAHQEHLKVWTEKAEGLLNASADARLDLLAMHRNADVFSQLRDVLRQQREAAETEAAALRSWVTRGEGRVRTKLEGQVAQLRAQLAELHEKGHGLAAEVRTAELDEAARSAKERAVSAVGWLQPYQRTRLHVPGPPLRPL